MNNFKVLGYIPLFYGKEFIYQCIKSMEPYVEKILVIYVDKPSQGHSTDLICPENEQELRVLAESASNKIEWHKQDFGSEGEHREYIYNFSDGYDLIFTLDADEVVEEKDIENALLQAYNGDRRYYGIGGFINFWRSFDWVCYDSFTPVRIINLRNNYGQGVVSCRVYHFSCAQCESIVRYKWAISGHKDELRTNWIDDIFYKWTPDNDIKDLHPVAFGLWQATPFDKTTLPEVLKLHPNYNKTI